MQGSTVVRQVNHQIVMEAVYATHYTKFYQKGAAAERVGPWYLVDIDNWLGGNRFWEKIQRKVPIRQK